MPVLGYLAAVVLLVGSFFLSASWLIGSSPAPVATSAQASNVPTAPVYTPTEAELASGPGSMSPVYPTYVGKGLALGPPNTAELMRKKLQQQRAERPKKKRKPVAPPATPAPDNGTQAYAYSPHRQPDASSWFWRDDR